VAAATLLVIQARRPKRANPLVGVALPPLEAGGWLHAERPPSAAELRGNVVLVDFWSTDCPACVSDIPKLVEFRDQFRAQGLVVIGLTPETNAFGRLTRFVERADGVDWPIGYGAGLTFDLLGIQFTPTYVLFDRAGRSVWSGHSLDGLEDAAIRALAKKVES
jgi:thiol-disulfide isomerase/thioredoxin